MVSFYTLPANKGLPMSHATPIQYRIIPKAPEAHIFEVSCRINKPDPAGQRVSLPNWIPGSYLIRDFAKHIIELTASSQGQLLPVTKINKNTWQCASTSHEITLVYTVYAYDLSVRGAHLDTTHGFFNATSVFLAVDGALDYPCEVEIIQPQGEAYQNWRVATVLPEKTAKRHGFGKYIAENYAHLIDTPVEIGEFDLLTFEACGVPHEIALTGKHRADLKRLTHDIKQVCEQHIRFFGGKAPFDRYMFLLTALGEAHGGLEHRACSALQCSRRELPLSHEKQVSDDYCKLLGLFSHEYFHAWHVKRIKPAAFMPYDLNKECYTQLLWVFEGITSYYDDLALVRSKLITPQQYLQLLAQTMMRVSRTPGRLKQTVAQSSFDAWIKLYQPNENTPNAVISYYVKGSLIALALDLLIRKRTDNKKSLDDVMKMLWQQYGKTGVGVSETGVEEVVAQITGESYQEFFETALHRCVDLEFKPLFDYMGVELQWAPALSSRENPNLPALGVLLANNMGEAVLMHVNDGSAAQVAGLSAGDIIIAIDELKVMAFNLEDRISSYQAGDSITVHAFRRDELMHFQVVLQPAANQLCVLGLKDTADTATHRTQWLQ
jgi:predicted metalloprotease with PDZ domain